MADFIDADDIADVAVAALTDDAHAGKTHDLTGPRLVQRALGRAPRDFRDYARNAAAAWSRGST